ncbi:SMR family transporter [Sedimentitalea sp.]|uniref:DMT family transporter n=1 Tax=Sedimentitalea sp. TaxID=2048915 RepID=UPI0032988841
MLPSIPKNRSLHQTMGSKTYTVWTGIGAVGAFAIGVVLLGEAMNPTRLFVAGLILAGIVLMKTSGTSECIAVSFETELAAKKPFRLRHERSISIYSLSRSDHHPSGGLCCCRFMIARGIWAVKSHMLDG